MFTIVAANDNAVANTEGAKQASALIFAQHDNLRVKLLGSFVTDQMLPPKGNGTVISKFLPINSISGQLYPSPVACR